MKKPFTLSLFLFSLTLVFGQIIDSSATIATECTSAHDSVNSRIARNEIGFYGLVKFKKNQYNFITIDKNKYTKFTYPKGTPNEEYIQCYNNKMTKRLDSTFKVSFFEKSDSILKSYDNSGRGYKNAEFPGGPGALQKFISKNVSMPKDAKIDDTEKNDANTLVQVFYSFIIDEKGNISDISLIKSNCSLCKEPVLEAIMKLPAFIPATEAGKPSKVKYILPYMKKL